MPDLHLAWLVIAAFIGIVGWAVLTDILHYRIPNVASAALVLLYPAWLAAAWPAADPWTTIALHLGVGLAALVVGFILFTLRAFGAGDAKLLAAVALWAGPAGILDLVLVTAVAGGILAIVVLLVRRFVSIWEPQLLMVQVTLSRVAHRLFPRQPAVAGEAGTARRGPIHSTFARPIPYGVAIAAGAAVVAYGLLTTSGAA
jgi:prepilin peptidase CpaA